MKPMEERHLAVLRKHMVEMIEILVDLAKEELGKAVLDERVMAAMLKVPRHIFVPQPVAPYAYHDTPLPIGFDKTISQPFMVALMTDLLAPQSHETILEIGTGFGYQTAILAELAAEVITIEVVAALAAAAEAKLKGLGYHNIECRVGDGAAGCPERAPFDGIMVTAAARSIPEPLLDQLAPGGRLVVPLGHDPLNQDLCLVEKDAQGALHERRLFPVAFVPLTGGGDGVPAT
jgi:protein-L-isoaspartate(D-aspartate) O-methyltransferase